jgi:hypothetical protein
VIPVPSLFSDGNVFFILSKCRRPARKAGWTDERFRQFNDEAMACGSYDAVIQHVMRHFEEAP